MVFRSAAKALDGAKCLLFASVTNKPPGGFGGEKDKDQEGGLHKSASEGPRSHGGTHREDPLQGKRYSPRPLTLLLIEAVRDASDNN